MKSISTLQGHSCRVTYGCCCFVTPALHGPTILSLSLPLCGIPKEVSQGYCVLSSPTVPVHQRNTDGCVVTTKRPASLFGRTCILSYMHSGLAVSPSWSGLYSIVYVLFLTGMDLSSITNAPLTCTFPKPLQFIISFINLIIHSTTTSAPPLCLSASLPITLGPLQSPLPRLSLPLPTLQSPPRRPLRALQSPTRSISAHFCDVP
jgi:hypothetical protein